MQLKHVCQGAEILELEQKLVYINSIIYYCQGSISANVSPMIHFKMDEKGTFGLSWSVFHAPDKRGPTHPFETVLQCHVIFLPLLSNQLCSSTTVEHFVTLWLKVVFLWSLPMPSTKLTKLTGILTWVSNSPNLNMQLWVKSRVRLRMHNLKKNWNTINNRSRECIVVWHFKVPWAL